jgi:hypothetical protein
MARVLELVRANEPNRNPKRFSILFLNCFSLVLSVRVQVCTTTKALCARPLHWHSPRAVLLHTYIHTSIRAVIKPAP